MASVTSQLRRIEGFDVGGRRVRSFGGPLSTGFTWDGMDQAGRAIPKGLYLVRAETSAGPRSRPLVRVAR